MSAVQMPALSSTFSVVATLERAVGAAGYVVSLTGDSGSGGGDRLFSVYYSDISSSLTVFFTGSGGAQASVRFSHTLAATTEHTVLFAVEPAGITCIVTDSAGDVQFQSTASISSPVSTCFPLSPSCQLSIAQRQPASASGSDAPSTNAWIGTLSQLTLYPDMLLTAVPLLPASTPAPSTTTAVGGGGTTTPLDVLAAPTSGGGVIEGDVVSAEGGGLVFSGGVVLLTQHPPTNTGFTVRILLRQSPGDNGCKFYV